MFLFYFNSKMDEEELFCGVDVKCVLYVAFQRRFVVFFSSKLRRFVILLVYLKNFFHIRALEKFRENSSIK